MLGIESYSYTLYCIILQPDTYAFPILILFPTSYEVAIDIDWCLENLDLYYLNIFYYF